MIPIRGERLSKSQREAVQIARTAHLTQQQRDYLAALQGNVKQAQENRQADQTAYTLSVKYLGLHASGDAARRLRDTDSALNAAQVACRAAELSFGLTDSGRVPPTDSRTNTQGGPKSRR